MSNFQEPEIIKRVAEAVVISGALTLIFAANRKRIKEGAETVIGKLESAPQTPRRQLSLQILRGLKFEYMDEVENNLQTPNNLRR